MEKNLEANTITVMGENNMYTLHKFVIESPTLETTVDVVIAATCSLLGFDNIIHFGLKREINGPSLYYDLILKGGETVHLFNKNKGSQMIWFLLPGIFNQNICHVRCYGDNWSLLMNIPYQPNQLEFITKFYQIYLKTDDFLLIRQSGSDGVDYRCVVRSLKNRPDPLVFVKFESKLKRYAVYFVDQKQSWEYVDALSTDRNWIILFPDRVPIPFETISVLPHSTQLPAPAFYP